MYQGYFYVPGNLQHREYVFLLFILLLNPPYKEGTKKGKRRWKN